MVGQPITNDLSEAFVVSHTSSRQVANQISLTRTRCLSLKDDVDLKAQNKPLLARPRQIKAEKEVSNRRQIAISPSISKVTTELCQLM